MIDVFWYVHFEKYPPEGNVVSVGCDVNVLACLQGHWLGGWVENSPYAKQKYFFDCVFLRR